jgi:hypothetical protein
LIAFMLALAALYVVMMRHRPHPPPTVVVNVVSPAS